MIITPRWLWRSKWNRAGTLHAFAEHGQASMCGQVAAFETSEAAKDAARCKRCQKAVNIVVSGAGQ